jgi:hypothetical protein
MPKFDVGYEGEQLGRYEGDTPEDAIQACAEEMKDHPNFKAETPARERLKGLIAVAVPARDTPAGALEIQIEQRGTGVQGMGGLNYKGLESLGWKPGMWLPVVSKGQRGVNVKLPDASGLTFIHDHEITAQREAPRVRTNHKAPAGPSMGD